MYSKKPKQRADDEECAACHGTGVIIISNPADPETDSHRFVPDAREQGALLWAAPSDMETRSGRGGRSQPSFPNSATSAPVRCQRQVCRGVALD
jgi:hypothetical protein